MNRWSGMRGVVWMADGGSGSGGGSSGSAAPDSGGSSPATAGSSAAPSSTPSPSPSSSSSADSGTASGKPSAPRATGVPADAPTTKAPPSMDFGVLFGDSDPPEEDLDLSQVAGALDAPDPAVKPKVPPKPPMADEAAAQAPKVQTEGQPSGVQDGAAAPAGVDPADPMSLAAALQANEAQATAYIAESMFKLTPEDIEALETDVVSAIPTLLARTFVRSQQNVLTQMGKLIPQMIERHSVLMRRNAENEGKFFARWPDLKADVHGDLVRKYAVTYRRMHPQATMEQMMEDLGPMIMMAARVAPSGVPAGGGRPNGSRAVSPPPFVPAQGGPAASATQIESQAWDILDPSRGD